MNKYMVGIIFMSNGKLCSYGGSCEYNPPWGGCTFAGYCKFQV
jgi:hypothetical protein